MAYPFVVAKITPEKGIVSNNAQGGKRAFRVYPSWDNTISPQAQ